MSVEFADEGPTAAPSEADLIERVEAKREHPDLDELEAVLRKHGLALSDFAVALGRKELRKQASKGRVFITITIEDIKQFPDPKFLIENVLIEDTITLLGSYPGKGKTLVALSLMRSVLDGFPWLGKYTVNRQGPVLLINEESPDSVLKTYTAKIPEDAPFYALHFEQVRIDRTQDQAALEEVIREIDPVLVVIDSFIRVHGQEENSSIGMAQVIAYLRRLTNTGITILLLHHHGKGNGPLETRARGSSDIPAGVDLELALYEKKGRLILRSVKSRFRPFEPIILQIFDDDGVPDIKLAQSVEEAAKNAIGEFVNEDPVGFKAIREAVEEAGVDVGVNKLRKLLNGMVGKGLLEITLGGRNKKLYSSLPVSRASRE